MVGNIFYLPKDIELAKEQAAEKEREECLKIIRAAIERCEIKSWNSTAKSILSAIEKRSN